MCVKIITIDYNTGKEKAQIRQINMAQFKYLLYKKQELEKNGILPEDLRLLFEKVRQHQVAVIGINAQSLPQYMNLQGISPESALVLAATDRTLGELKGLPIASVGCRSLAFPHEELYQADVLAEAFWEVDYDFLERIYQRRHGIPWRVIETKRCYLREMTLSDLPELYALYKDAGFSRYIDPLHSWEEEIEYTKAYIEHMYRFYGFGMWLIIDRFTDELIGRAGFNLIEGEEDPVLEMGYAIAVDRQKQGYAAEVCRALIVYAKEEEMGFDKIYCFVQKENVASLGLLKKLGFRFCRECMRDGKSVLLYEYDLTNCELGGCCVF